MARDLVAAGAQVPCFVATSEATRDAALPGLRDFAGVTPRGYLDLQEMLDAESLDALAILSPPEHHAEHLGLALGAGLHVLCEKPFVWGGSDLLARSQRLLDGFRERGLLVRENCQWPYTLSAFEALHPGSLAAPPSRFEMELEPLSSGLQSLGDALPHPISLLQALCPGAPDLEAIEIDSEGPGGTDLTIRFRYRTEACSCAVRVALRQRETGLRHAAYALDGRRARRVVSADDYRLSFVDSDRSVPVADPLTQLVGDFVAALRAASDGADPPARQIQERLHLLVALANTYEEIR